jgi:zinc transport system substrate-binding protein
MRNKICKGVIALLVIVAVLFTAACGGNGPAGTGDASEKKKISVVTTIYPYADWIKNVVGDEKDHVEITYLLDNNVDLHSYQPTVQDVVKISTADLFIYGGGMSDSWVDKALQESSNPAMLTVNLISELGDRAREEELVEGMQGEEEEEHDEDEKEYDEHLWLSVKNAAALVPVIAGKLSEADPERKAVYEANAASYREKLEVLDRKYEEATGTAAVKTLVFADRFPFLYLAKDYGLTYYAAFIGCSAETEASFETVAFLARKVDELKLTHIMVIETSDQKIAETVKSTSEAKNQTVLVMDSMQSVRLGEEKDYLSVMEENLKVLEEALK